MTKRSIVIGLVLAVVLCSITYFNQSVMRQTPLVGDYLPISVFGTLILVLLFLNPALRHLRPAWQFKGPELAVILTLVLTACGVAEYGILKTFTNVLMLPRRHRKMNPAWDHEGVFERLPKHMLADPGTRDEALDGFVQGKAGNVPVSLGDVPWNAWLTPLFTWLPVVLLITVAFIALALVMHRQWSEHENLPYPISTFARSLWGGEGGGSVFAQQGFWIAAGVVLSIHLINFSHTWWPQYTVAIPTRFNFYPVAQLFPTFTKGGGFAWSLSQFRIYFCVIGFAYLVSSDVSFSFAVAPFIYAIAGGILATYGISTGAGGEHRASIYTSVNIGSFVAFVAMIGYFGRRHYWAVLRRAFGLKAAEESESHEVWGMRTFLVCSVLATVLMVAYGLAWPFAIVYMLSVVVFYVGVSRIVAETGLFFMKPAWVPHIVLLGVFGTRALGPTAALIAMFFSAVLFAEAKQLVMPYVANSLHLLSREGVKPGRVVAWSVVAVTLGLVAGLVVTLCLQYNKGTDMAAGGWFTHTVPSYPFRISADMSQRMRSQGTFEESDSMPSWKRPLAARPEKKFAISFIVGAALVVICYIGRLRIAGWPFHPAVLLLWNWFHVSKLTFSFFLGWAIKKGASRYGGIAMVQRLKPVMIGLIAGEMLGGFIPAIISAIYYFVTGETPKAYLVMPSA